MDLQLLFQNVHSSGPKVIDVASLCIRLVTFSIRAHLDPGGISTVCPGGLDPLNKVFDVLLGQRAEAFTAHIKPVKNVPPWALRAIRCNTSAHGNQTLLRLHTKGATKTHALVVKGIRETKKEIEWVTNYSDKPIRT